MKRCFNNLFVALLATMSFANSGYGSERDVVEIAPDFTLNVRQLNEQSENQEITVLSTYPEAGQKLPALYTGESITFELSDNTNVSVISCVITSIINSNNAEEPFGSFRTSDINDEGLYYWTNNDGPLYFLEGRTYRFQYFVYNLDNKVCCSGQFDVIGTTDPDSLVDYDFQPTQTEITYTGTPSDVENVVVTFIFDEDAYCDFNKFLKLELTDAEGQIVRAQFTNQSSMREPTKYGIKISGSGLKFNENYILHVPTIYGDADWFGVTGNDRYMSGRANAPMDIKFNLSTDGIVSVKEIISMGTSIYYNINGVPLSKDKTQLTPGIYICNGHKVYIPK